MALAGCSYRQEIHTDLPRHFLFCYVTRRPVCEWDMLPEHACYKALFSSNKSVAHEKHVSGLVRNTEYSAQLGRHTHM